MSDENRMPPPAPPAAPPAAPQEQSPAAGQAAPTPPQYAQPQPPVAPQQTWQQQAPGQQTWQQPAPGQQTWQQPGPGQQAWQQQGGQQQNWQQQGGQQQQTQQNFQQAQQSFQQQAGGGAPTWDQLKASGNYQIPAEYPADRFNPESFSIPAFFFSWIWYMVKGMWQKGLLILGVGFVISFVIPIFGSLLFIGVMVYTGLFGHRDYLRYYNSKQQFWF